jgi:hypothetical protein
MPSASRRMTHILDEVLHVSGSVILFGAGTYAHVSSALELR